MEEPRKGFFAALFDVSFSEFITTRLIKLLFVLAIAIGAVAALMVAVGCLVSGDGGSGVIGLLMAPVVFIVYVISVRIWLELVIVVFNIAENTSKLAKRGEL